MERLDLIVDCDAGMDDAMAIALAAAAPSLRIEAVTSVAGNAPVGMTTRNALATVVALGLDCPVYRGHAGPEGSTYRFGNVLWGGDGDLRLARTDRAPEGDATGFLVSRLERAAPRSVSLVPIGPLTNIAAVLDRRPDLAGRVAQMIVMGGAFHGGNVTEHAEFNIWFDPPAAARTFEADIPAVIVPYDLTRHIVVEPWRIEKLRTSDAVTARLGAHLLPLAGIDNHPSSIHDAATIGWLLWPELFESQTGTVSVVVRQDAEFGRTLLAPDPDGRHRVLTGVDCAKFLDRMMALLTGNGP